MQLSRFQRSLLYAVLAATLLIALYLYLDMEKTANDFEKGRFEAAEEKKRAHNREHVNFIDTIHNFLGIICVLIYRNLPSSWTFLITRRQISKIRWKKSMTQFSIRWTRVKQSQ